MKSDYFESLDVSSMADDFSDKPGDLGKTKPIIPDYPDGPWKKPSGTRVGDDPKSQGELTEITLPPSVKMDPAVGWLVCVEGVDKGRSFRLVKGNNPIGRNGNEKNYSVALTDQAISRKGAAGVIVYNEKSNQFFITPGDLTTNINPYLNEEILLSPKLLTPRSTLEIAGDILIFVPFCSDKFKWKFEDEPEKRKAKEPEQVISEKEQIVRCERGHYYNASIHDKCPYCEESNQDNDPDGVTKIMYR